MNYLHAIGWGMMVWMIFFMVPSLLVLFYAEEKDKPTGIKFIALICLFPAIGAMLLAL